MCSFKQKTAVNCNSLEFCKNGSGTIFPVNLQYVEKSLKNLNFDILKLQFWEKNKNKLKSLQLKQTKEMKNKITLYTYFLSCIILPSLFFNRWVVLIRLWTASVMEASWYELCR